MSNPAIIIAALVFGACIGSFLNVCIYRIPAGESIVSPGSKCPGCARPIRAYDNIPVVSFILLMGRCRACGQKISFRYPMVELITAGFAACSILKYGLSPAAPLIFAFICALIVITFIDIDHRIIPDAISLSGIPIGLFASHFFLDLPLSDGLIGILAGGGSLFLVGFGYRLITGIEGMGGGDVKLLAMIGAVIGWQGVVFTLFAASVTGSVIGLALMLANGKDMKLAVPFGPFLSMGAVLYIFFGQFLISWYFGTGRLF
ncbi:MAG: prepilin peptidase [Deltaproteobacteria bacterium]|nr:prepilin peptidase [Deltaproteobacteria bacterium]